MWVLNLGSADRLQDDEIQCDVSVGHFPVEELKASICFSAELLTLQSL